MKEHKFKRLCTYVIKRHGVPGLFSVAVIPEIRPTKNGMDQFCFFDGERGHMLDGKVLVATETTLSFSWVSSVTGKPFAALNMRPITMPEYKMYLKPHIDPHGRFIHDMEDLSSFMLRRTPRG